MENLVTTLDTSKKLRAAGFPQYALTALFWVPETGHGSIVDTYMLAIDPYGPKGYAAPTAQEIADQLPEKTCMVQLTWQIYLKKWLYFASEQEDDMWLEGPTMAEALAALWLKLQEKK